MFPTVTFWNLFFFVIGGSPPSTIQLTTSLSKIMTGFKFSVVINFIVFRTYFSFLLRFLLLFDIVSRVYCLQLTFFFIDSSNCNGWASVAFVVLASIPVSSSIKLLIYSYLLNSVAKFILNSTRVRLSYILLYHTF